MPKFQDGLRIGLLQYNWCSPTPNDHGPADRTLPFIAFEIKIMNSQEVIDAVEANKAHIGLIEKPSSLL